MNHLRRRFTLARSQSMPIRSSGDSRRLFTLKTANERSLASAISKSDTCVMAAELSVRFASLNRGKLIEGYQRNLLRWRMNLRFLSGQLFLTIAVAHARNDAPPSSYRPWRHLDFRDSNGNFASTSRLNGGVNMPAFGNSINPNELTQLTAFLQSRKRPMPRGWKRPTAENRTLAYS